MYQLLIEEVFPPPRTEEGAIALLFEGSDAGQRVIVGVQGVLVADWGRPITIQLPAWCHWSPHVSCIDGGLYKWAMQPAKEPFSMLWPEDLAQARYTLGTLPLKLYFGEEPPALRGIFKPKP